LIPRINIYPLIYPYRVLRTLKVMSRSGKVKKEENKPSLVSRILKQSSSKSFGFEFFFYLNLMPYAVSMDIHLYLYIYLEKINFIFRLSNFLTIFLLVLRYENLHLFQFDIVPFSERVFRLFY